MIVKVIGIDWASAPVPLQGVIGDSMKAKGWLLRGTEVARNLAEMDVYIEAGPKAQFPNAAGIWPVYPAVDATSLRLKLFSNEMPHTLDIDGVKVPLQAGKAGTWATYEIPLRRTA